MKRTKLRRIGEQGRKNLLANKKLKGIYFEKGIITCELRFKGCTRDWGLSFAHKHKRYWYHTREGLDSFEETILACLNCHNIIEGNEELTNQLFKELRDN